MDNGVMENSMESTTDHTTDVNGNVTKNLPKAVSFERRQYQVELIELAIRENVILTLPTGSGKTFIALKVIERFLADNYGTRKKVIFLATTVPLVKQQAEFLRNTNENWTVHSLVGDMGTDFYNPQDWNKLLAECDVFVMTPEIMCRAILHKNMSWDQICLLILDECHHATGGHNYVKLMDTYKLHRETGSKVPRVVGLTATIVKGSVKVSQIETAIEKIQSTLCCRAVTHPNFDEILKFSTSARVDLVKLNTPKWSAKVPIFEDLQRLMYRLTFSSGNGSNDNQNAEIKKNLNLPRAVEFFNRKRTILEKLASLLSDFLKLYTELGPYCSCIASSLKEYTIQKYICEVESLNVTETATSMLLNAAITDLIHLRQNIVRFMDGEYEKKLASGATAKLMSKQAFSAKEFNSEKIDALLDIFSKRNEAYVAGEEEPLCGLVFCERRINAQVLAWFLQDLATHCSEYSFLKVDFLLGSSAKLDLEAGRLASNWQSNVLTRFREKELNLIVATSVLEEGLDVPSCNLVVRFDPVQNYPSYIQSMGRARMKSARFYVLVAEAEFTTQSNTITNYQCFNKELAVILARKLIDDGEDEMEIAKSTQSRLTTFSPGGNIDSPVLPESEAIPAVYRYCSMLKSDGLPQPAPVSWCSREADGNFKAYLLLPCNAPVKDVIEGDACPNKTLAKQSVFCKACILLCKFGELTDTLLPRNQEEEFESKFLDDLLKENKHRDKGVAKLGTKKSTAVYSKIMPLRDLAKSLTAQQPVFLYQVQLTTEPFKTLRQSALGYYYDFERHPYNFGFLSTLPIASLPVFSLRVKTGAIKVKVVRVADQFSLSKVELDSVVRFQEFMKDFVYCMPRMETPKQENGEKLLVVPLKKSENDNGVKIYWEKMKELQGFHLKKYNVLLSDEEKANFKFSRNSYFDAVVVPCYRDLIQNDSKMYCVSTVSETTTADSYMHSKKHNGIMTYAAHYLDLCRTKIQNTQLPLLLCRVVGKQRNFLRGERSKRCSGTCFEFPPEVVRLTPIPACFLLQGKYIPTILHRINRLLLASALQQRVGELYKWDVNRLGGDPEFFQGIEEAGVEPMDWNNIVESQELAIRLKILSVSITKELQSPAGIHYIHPNRRTWDQVQTAIEYENSLKLRCGDGANPHRSSSNKKKKQLPERLPVRDVTKGLIELDSIKFPSFDARTDFDKIKGPHLFQIMEALTLANANDYLDLERMEIMGDSVLKLVVSTHLFSNFPKWKEGKLTHVRTLLTSNEHLCAVALRRNLGRILGGGIFEPKEWTPPGFQASKEEATCTISDKSIADATEALIGAYYLEGGLDCSFRIMHWIGLQGPRENNLGPIDEPYSRETSFSRPEMKYSPGNKSPQQLVPYLADLEKIIDYKFENEWLLVEALTHSSYMDKRRVTQSYQRLEFLGDAVLDFLITHYIITSTKIVKPGRVTDLRSALVNNVTFGCISERYTFPLYLLHTSDVLHDKITSFSEFQRERNHDLTDPYMLMTDEQTSIPQNVDIPKALGDVFEAITGAVYVDSNYSLDKVWGVVYRLMKREIDAFSTNIPVNPVRKLMEQFPNKVIITDAPLTLDRNSNLTCVKITIAGSTNIQAQGVGTRKKLAKEAAAKHILKKISTPP